MLVDIYIHSTYSLKLQIFIIWFVLNLQVWCCVEPNGDGAFKSSTFLPLFTSFVFHQNLQSNLQSFLWFLFLQETTWAGEIASTGFSFWASFKWGLGLNARCDDVTWNVSTQICEKSALSCRLPQTLQSLLVFGLISAIARTWNPGGTD